MTSNKTPRALARAGALAAALALAVLAVACGGGGGSASSASNGTGSTVAEQIAACGAKNYPALSVPTTGNSVPIIVDNGPCVYGTPSGSTTASAYVLGSANVPFTSVKICVPNTTTCQVIDHVLVDTGSTGLRIMSSVLNSALALPAVSVTGGPLIECVQFADGYSWGSVRTADVHLAGETAASIPVEVIGDSTAYTVPTACTGTSTTPLNDVASFGANGVLGVGLFAQDCGVNCVGNVSNGFYYVCPTTTTCTGYGPTTSQQVANPITFYTDGNSNGVVVQLPALADATATATMYGSLIFGINTLANNQTSGTTKVYEATNGSLQTVCGNTYTSGGNVIPLAGNFASTLVSSTGYTVPGSSTVYCNSFIDSGSNGLYLPNTTIPTDSGGWFTPTSPSIILIAATQQGIDASTGVLGSPTSFSFDIANADTLFNSGTGNDSVFNGLGAPSSGGQTDPLGGVDWGLPFFFGKTIFVGLEATNQTIGGVTATGPYWAY